MERWLTGTDVTERYSIGEQRLTEYSNRGDLPCRWDDSGRVYFDAETVALLFVPRGVELSASGRDLGRLGELTLGSGAVSPEAEEPVRKRRAPARRAAVTAPRKGRKVA